MTKTDRKRELAPIWQSAFEGNTINVLPEWSKVKLALAILYANEWICQVET